MHITRRPAEEVDRDFGRRVHHLAYRDVVERQYGPWVEADQDDFFDDNWTILGWLEIILCDGEPCGYLSLEHRMSGWIDLRELVILPEFQNRGIGTELLKQIMADAAAKRAPVWLQTHHVNRAQQLYRRMGFVETGKNATHIEFEWLPPGAERLPPVCR